MPTTFRPIYLMFAAACVAMTSPAVAGEEAFHAGTVVPAFGKVTTVANDLPLPADAIFRHSFDVSEAKKGELNKGLESAARFVNMMVEAGVPMERMKVAVVLHGPPIYDVSSAKRYAKAYKNTTNPNAALVDALLKAGVDIWVCGQSAAYIDVAKSDLLPGVKMALSAMTAHAELQRQGYSLNPF